MKQSTMYFKQLKKAKIIPFYSFKASMMKSKMASKSDQSPTSKKNYSLSKMAVKKI